MSKCCLRSALDFRNLLDTRFESNVRGVDDSHSCLAFRLIEEWLLAELEGATPESKLADLSLSSVSLAQLHPLFCLWAVLLHFCKPTRIRSLLRGSGVGL